MVIRGCRHVDYITARRQGAVYMRKSHRVSAFLEDLKTKVVNPIAVAEMEVDQLKFHQRLVDELKYCKEVLVSSRHAGGAADTAGVVGDEAGGTDRIGASPQVWDGHMYLLVYRM
jgi:hypothetical protein